MRLTGVWQAAIAMLQIFEQPLLNQLMVLVILWSKTAIKP